MKYGQIWMKKYAEWSEAKKKNRTIKRGPKKLNFGASKPGVGGAPPGSASGWPSDGVHVLETCPCSLIDLIISVTRHNLHLDYLTVYGKLCKKLLTTYETLLYKFICGKCVHFL